MYRKKKKEKFLTATLGRGGGSKGSGTCLIFFFNSQIYEELHIGLWRFHPNIKRKKILNYSIWNAYTVYTSVPLLRYSL